jgi:hypothetical protein
MIDKNRPQKYLNKDIETLKEAKEIAIELSKAFWNTYFQIHQKDSSFYISRYYDNNVIFYTLKGNISKH